jgi:DNA repair exonuclease SbcCD ATPase subunit
MITLQKLRWSNCFSYGADNELDLTDSTVTQIIGTNGMGKSSIPLIIEEALYNKNSKGIKKADIPNRYVNNGYSIYLSFSKDQDQYEVNIDRKSSIKLTLSKNGEDISSHTATNTYKSLQEIIGIDFKTFSQLVYQNTNTSLQFLTATDTNRKKFLIDLLHLENYVRLFELFKEESKHSNINLTSISSKIATVEKWLSDNKLSDTTILPPLEFTISTDEEEKELRSLMIEIQNISEKNKKISTNNHYKDALSKIDLTEVQDLSKYQKKSYDSLQSQLGSIEQAAAGSQRLLAKLEKLGDHCPTCEQSVDASFKQGLIDAEQTKLQEAEQKNAAIRDEIERIKEENRKYERGAKLQREWEDLYRSIDSELPSSQLDKNELEERAGRVRADLERAKGELEKIAAENEKRARRNTRIEVILEQTDDFQRDLKEHTDLLREEQEIASNLEVLKKAFSTNGLIAYKIENLVGELEELTNFYLAELSDGRFTLEFVVSNDKLNVQVTDNGNVVDILALSSGELARVNTATLIAIRKLMSSISKSRINILFLDEVINVLDESGREKLVEVLLEEDELNTYVVSHQWYHPLLSRIVINKKDNISYLEHD